MPKAVLQYQYSTSEYYTVSPGHALSADEFSVTGWKVQHCAHILTVTNL